MSKIKIAFIISNLGQGGAEKQFVTLIKNLDINRFEIHVFLYACQVEPFYNELHTNKSIQYKATALKNKSKILKITEAIFSIRRFLKSGRFDVVVTTLFMNNFLVRLASPSCYSKKVVANVRTSFDLYTRKLILSEKIQIRSSYLVFNSKKTYSEFARIFNQKYNTRLRCIYNGFELPQKNISNLLSSPIFGSLGRLSIEKNVLQAVRVFQEFEKKNPGIIYVIQGHYGNQYLTIKETVTSDRIEIREENPDIELFYDSINVLILPSLFEGCPNVLFEALLRKKLCIVSKGANSDGFIKNGINGFVYDGTDNGLLQTMIIVKKIMNTSAENEIREAGYQYAVNNFSVSSMVTQYEKLFIEIYEKNKSSN